MSRDEYEFETTATRAEAAAVLTDLADGLLAGSVLLGEEPDTLAVEPPGEMDVEVEFEADEDGTSLEVELEWSRSVEEATVSTATEPESDDATPAADEPVPTGSAGQAADDTADAKRERGDTDQTGSTESEIDTNMDPALDPVTLDTPVSTTDGAKSLARFELFRDRRDEWRWRLRHRNGNIIATSGEGYTRRHNARKGLQSVVTNAPGAEISEKRSE